MNFNTPSSSYQEKMQKILDTYSSLHEAIGGYIEYQKTIFLEIVWKRGLKTL